MTRYKRKLYVHITSYMWANSTWTVICPQPRKTWSLNCWMTICTYFHETSELTQGVAGTGIPYISRALYDPPDSVIAKVHEDANQVERHQGILQIVPCWSGNSWASYRCGIVSPHPGDIFKKNSFRKAIHTLDPTWMSENRVSLNWILHIVNHSFPI